MIRAVQRASSLARSRQCFAAWCDGHQVPRTCTLITASQSSTVMFQIAASRTMPALFTRMSSLPNSSIACCTISPDWS